MAGFLRRYLSNAASLGGALVQRLGIAISDDYADDASAPTITAGSGAPSASENNGSLYLRTSGLIYRRVGGAWEQVIGAAGTLVADTISELTSAAGVTVDGVLLKDGGVTFAGTGDLNGNELILDADADTSITADTDDEIDIRVSGADDFKILANTFRALSGSAIETNTINETTAAAGVTVDGVLLKDNSVTVGTAGQVVTDTIAEKTAAAGVTIDGVLLKDGVNRGTLYSSNVFLSAEITGNGGSQDTAHGLGATPVLVFAIPSDLTGGAFTVAYGAHDATNTKTTVTTGEKYRVVAFK